MTEKRWTKDPQNDVLARSEHAAEVVYEREQKAALDADQKARDGAKAFDEQRKEGIKAEQERQQGFFKQSEQAKQDAQMLADAQRNNAQQAQQINEQINPHRQEPQQVNYKELTNADRDRLNNAHEIRREFVERGEMRDSHAIAYPSSGASVYEQAANRELDADRDFAARQQRLAERIQRETDPQQKHYLEAVKGAEYHSHKAESWAIITDQRKECRYCKDDIDYARNQAAGHELQAAQYLERLKELDLAKNQTKEQAGAKEQGQQAQQAPQTARQAPNETQQGQSKADTTKGQERPLEQSQGQQSTAFKSVKLNQEWGQDAKAEKGGTDELAMIGSMLKENAETFKKQAQEMVSHERNQQSQEPRDMAVLNKIRERNGMSSLRDDLIELEKRHNAAKAERGDDSRGLKGDLERLEQRHNAAKAEREQGQDKPQEPRRRGSGLEM